MNSTTLTFFILGFVVIATAFATWFEFSNMLTFAPLASVEYTTMTVVLIRILTVALGLAGLFLLFLPFWKKEPLGTVIE